MKLKRIYEKDEQDNNILKKVVVLHHGEKQNFSQKFINESLASGLVEISNGSVNLMTEPKLSYKIDSHPSETQTSFNCTLIAGV